jgi:pimeloyl-ACP methyl ester carboxylesterase/AraC-like DNA-binding protein
MTRLPDNLTETPGVGARMDVLADVLGSLRLSGGVVVDGQLTGEFCMNAQFTPEECAPFFPAPDLMIGYHYIRSGSGIIQIDGQAAEPLSAGDIAILPRNDSHILASRPGLDPAKPDEVSWVTEGGVHRITTGTEGPGMQMWCGILGTSRSNAHPIIDALPPLLILRTRDRASEWLDSSLRFLAEGQPSPDVLSRLAELFLVQAIRDYVAGLPSDASAWLRGLVDPAVSKALSIIHTRYAEELDVEGLAREAGVSRTVLGERFAELLGEPPMRYCARWRMRMAANMLRDGRQNSANVGYSVGFNSEAAFNRAFKREFGVPPATWRRQVEEQDQAESASAAMASPPPAQEIGSCTSADGCSIAYASSGQGFPLVKAPNAVTHLEHDWSNPIFGHWIAELSRSNRLLRFDMRGFGLSEREPERFSMDAMVEDLAAVVDASGVKTFDLVGLTHGAAIAIAFAARNPKKVRKLVLLNSFPAGWAIRADPAEIALRKGLVELNRNRWRRENVILGERFMSLYFPSEATEIVEWHKTRVDDICTAETVERMLEWGSRIDIRDELKNVRAETLVLHADHDGNAPIEIGREVADGIAGARFVELESDNHVTLANEPAWPVVVRELRAFLGG